MADAIDRDSIWPGKYLGGEAENFVGVLLALSDDRGELKHLHTTDTGGKFDTALKTE